MATLTHRRGVIELLENLGKLSKRAKPQFEELWEYEHLPTGKVLWAVFTKRCFNDLDRNPFVGQKLLLWSWGLGKRHGVGDLEKAIARQKAQVE